MNWLVRRLREPSTWRGLVWLATVAGLSLRPDQAEAIVAAGMALAGLLGVFLSDEPKTVTIENQDGDANVRATGRSPLPQKGRPVSRAGGDPERGDPVADSVRHPVPAERPFQRVVDPDDVPEPRDNGWNG